MDKNLGYKRNQLIIVTDVESGEVYKFDKQKDAARFLGVSDSVVCLAIYNARLIYGKYYVKKIIKVRTDK